MNKRICDICDKREGNNKFRIQQEKEVVRYSTFFGLPIPKMDWVEIDICDECFEKIKTIKDYKNR